MQTLPIQTEAFSMRMADFEKELAVADEFESLDEVSGYEPTGDLGSAVDAYDDYSGFSEDPMPDGSYSSSDDEIEVSEKQAGGMQQTLARAGETAAGAARNASAAMAEGFSALRSVAAASREHSGARAQLREMESAIEGDRAELEHRLSIESDYMSIVSSETAELRDAQGVADEATATIESLSAERDELNNQLSALKAENEQTLRPYKTLVESTRSRSDDASRILGDARRAVKDAESQVDEATRRREQSIASANRALDSAQERLRKVKEDLKALQDNPGSALSAIFDLKGEVAQEAASVEAARADVQTVASDSQYAVDAAQKQLFTLRQTLETAEADYETAKREAEDRRAEYDRIHKDCIQREQALQREIDTRVAGIDDAEDVLRGAEERIGEAQAVLDEANGIHSTPEVTEALLASVNQQQAAINAQKARIDELATSEKSLRESTRGKRFLFIGVIAAAVILLIVILWLIFGPK